MIGSEQHSLVSISWPNPDARASLLTCPSLHQLFPTGLGSKALAGPYRATFLQFHRTSLGRSAADLAKEATIDALAWVIRHFVPLVAANSSSAWGSLLAEKPIQSSAPSSDLAFAVLVLEHHMLQWRWEVLFRLEAGSSPPQEPPAGLLCYKAGMAGEEAKSRYEGLCDYFQCNFGESSCNTSRLQAKLNEMVRMDSECIRRKAAAAESNGRSPPPCSDRVQDDVLHRVFYGAYL